MRARNRQLEIGVALVLAFVLCACGASARQRMIRLTYETVNIADDQLIEYTKTHGKALYDEAHAAGKTKEEADVTVNVFLAKAQHAQLTIRAVYRMVAAAAALNDDRSLSTLLTVAKMALAELRELGLDMKGIN